MNIAEFYEKTGGDYNDVLERLLNKEDLVHRFLKKFLNDPSYNSLEEAVKNGNVEEIFRASHTLKGVVSNLGLKPLLDATHVLVEITRVGKSEGIQEAYENISIAYKEITELIMSID